MTVNAHFDGSVIVPDEPVNLQPNQPVILHIETVSGAMNPPEESALSWLASHAIDTETLPENLADRHDYYLYRNPSGDQPR